MIDRDAAETYASWFRCLADPTRIQILNLLARQQRPMTVGEIVQRTAVGQSTVSTHLRKLAETCFVLVEHRGTSSYFRVNERCLDAFPAASEVVMGRAAPDCMPSPRPGVTARRPRSAPPTSAPQRQETLR